VSKTLDKTWTEINTAITTQPVILMMNYVDSRKVCYVVQTEIDDDRGRYYVEAIEYVFSGGNVSISVQIYLTYNKNGYPIKQ
jgi:hypothetical protein